VDEKESHKEESSTNKFVVNFNIYYLKIFNRFSSKRELLLQHSWDSSLYK